MSTQPKPFLSPRDYLEIERAAAFRSEYLDGEMFAMAGASPRHALVVTNVAAELRALLRDRPCTVFSTDLRLRVAATGLFTYPDVVVACGELEFVDDERDTLLNPRLIVEVLSPSTQDYDRGGKFEHYRAVPSLIDYLLIAQHRVHAELFTRSSDGSWVFTETDDLDAKLRLGSVDVELELREVYHKVGLLGVG